MDRSTDRLFCQIDKTDRQDRQTARLTDEQTTDLKTGPNGFDLSDCIFFQQFDHQSGRRMISVCQVIEWNESPITVKWVQSDSERSTECNQTNRQEERQTDSETDKQTDRQTQRRITSNEMPPCTLCHWVWPTRSVWKSPVRNAEWDSKTRSKRGSEWKEWKSLRDSRTCSLEQRGFSQRTCFPAFTACYHQWDRHNTGRELKLK